MFIRNWLFLTLIFALYACFANGNDVATSDQAQEQDFSHIYQIVDISQLPDCRLNDGSFNNVGISFRVELVTPTQKSDDTLSGDVQFVAHDVDGKAYTSKVFPFTFNYNAASSQYELSEDSYISSQQMSVPKKIKDFSVKITKGFRADVSGFGRYALEYDIKKTPVTQTGESPLFSYWCESWSPLKLAYKNLVVGHVGKTFDLTCGDGQREAIDAVVTNLWDKTISYQLYLIYSKHDHRFYRPLCPNSGCTLDKGWSAYTIDTTFPTFILTTFNDDIDVEALEIKFLNLSDSELHKDDIDLSNIFRHSNTPEDATVTADVCFPYAVSIPDEKQT